MSEPASLAPAAAALRPVVAAFDVDGTLTTRDCVVPFLRRINGTTRTAWELARRARRLAPALLRRDRDVVKALASDAVFAGRSHAAVSAVARSFADDVYREWLREDTVASLREHQQLGHVPVLVSASFAVYLRPLAERLGVEHVLGTELEIDGAGLCTGGLVGGNCRGAAKVARLHDWLDGHLGGRQAVELWAYGDSPGDRELIADADHGRWVRG